MKPCIFFDRDGIANTSPSPEEYYVLRPDRFFVEPGFLDALQVVNDSPCEAVIVTNQYSIGRGLLTEEGLEAIHDKLRAALYERKLQLLDIYYCPHGEDHPDRKPNPGMLLRAAMEHDLDLSRSWMIGDTERDIEAGKRAGCLKTVLVGGEPTGSEPDFRVASMDDLAGFLKEHLVVS